MAEIVNLRQMRKRRARDEKRARGEEAAARAGLTKAARELAAAEAAAATARLDGHRREAPQASPRTDPACGDAGDTPPAPR